MDDRKEKGEERPDVREVHDSKTDCSYVNERYKEPKMASNRIVSGKECKDREHVCGVKCRVELGDPRKIEIENVDSQVIGDQDREKYQHGVP
jgi:predicted nucleic acid-binding Zn finger protein